MVVGMESVELSQQKHYETDKNFQYPKFDYSVINEDDIALIRLKKPVEFIKPERYPYFSYDKNDENDLNVTVLGWGQTGKESPISSTLLKLDKKTMNDEDCEKFLPEQINVGPGQICTPTSTDSGMCYVS